MRPAAARVCDPRHAAAARGGAAGRPPSDVGRRGEPLASPAR